MSPLCYQCFCTQIIFYEASLTALSVPTLIASIMYLSDVGFVWW